MTKITYELEAITEGIPGEAEKYYRASGQGREVIEVLGKAFGDEGWYSFGGLLDSIDRYLDQSANLLSERGTWNEQS